MREFRAIIETTEEKLSFGGIMLILQKSSRNLYIPKRTEASLEVCRGPVLDCWFFPLICHLYVLNIFYIMCILEDVATLHWRVCLLHAEAVNSSNINATL